jgi:hypothetical protein
MKFKLTMLSLLCLFTISFIACKKDTTSTKAVMTGRWNINKIVVSGSATATENGTFNYTASDYIDFKDTNDDKVELTLNGQTKLGTYSVYVGESFTMVFADGTYYCTVNSLSQNSFQFTAKLDKANTIKVYSLSR